MSAESSPKKRRGRPPKVKFAQIEEKGNAAFSLKGVEPSRTIARDDVGFDDDIVGVAAPASHHAPGAITAEDLALEREIQNMHLDQPVLTDDGDAPPPARKENAVHNHLKDWIDSDYKPASTLRELDDQVFQAKEHECDCIDGTEQLVKHFTRRCWADTLRVGYFSYHDIKVYIAGHFERAIARDNLTQEQGLFGKYQSAGTATQVKN